MSAQPEILHASAVAVDNKGLLIIGGSGSGKSSLALELIALGARLIADDTVIVTPKTEDAVWASVPETTQGLIEARGVGVLATSSQGAFLSAVVDLDEIEKDRLPIRRDKLVAGVSLPLLYRVVSPSFASILLVYLKGQRCNP